MVKISLKAPTFQLWPSESKICQNLIKRAKKLWKKSKKKKNRQNLKKLAKKLSKKFSNFFQNSLFVRYFFPSPLTHQSINNVQQINSHFNSIFHPGNKNLLYLHKIFKAWIFSARHNKKKKNLKLFMICNRIFYDNKTVSQ